MCLIGRTSKAHTNHSAIFDTVVQQDRGAFGKSPRRRKADFLRLEDQYFIAKLRAFGDLARPEVLSHMPNENLARLEEFTPNRQLSNAD